MKRGSFVSKNWLDANKWHFVTVFASCQVWALEKQRILWDPITKEVILSYEERER